MTLDSFLEKLEGVRKNGANYLAVCPAHKDSSPSLSVKVGKEWILVHCFAGCSIEEVCESLGIDVKDLAITSPARDPAYQTWGLETLVHPRKISQEDLEVATLFVDLHTPKPVGLERIKLIQAVYKRLSVAASERLRGRVPGGGTPHA